MSLTSLFASWQAFLYNTHLEVNVLHYNIEEIFVFLIQMAASNVFKTFVTNGFEGEKETQIFYFDMTKYSDPALEQLLEYM